MNTTKLKYIISISLLMMVQLVQAQWISLSSGTTKKLNEIFFLNSNIGFVAGSSGTVLKTTDAGTNWINISPTLQKDLHDLYFIDNNLGWVVGDSGSICKTTNAGLTWSIIHLPNAEEIQLHSVFALNQNTVFVGGSNALTNHYLFKSTNGGDTWQAVNVETYLWNIDILKIGMTSETIGYALTRGNVLKTLDGGLNWFITDTTSVKSGIMFSILEDFAYFPNSDTLYVCGWYLPYFGASYNAASQWNHNTNYDYFNLDFITKDIGYVGGWGFMHKTTDGGKTFVDVGVGTNSSMFSDIYSIDFTDENTGYACGENGKIIKTQNGGSTGISDIESAELRIYPNPTKDYIYVNELVNISVYNVYGQLLGQEFDTNKLDLRDFPPGVYLLNLVNPSTNKNTFSKIVLE